MTAIRAAVGLLTRLPLVTAGPQTGAAAFGLVGAMLGVAAAVPILLLGAAAPLAAGALVVAIGAALSGALHLDGLADTADALAAPDPARAEEARNDPRVGAAGAAAIAIAVLTEASLVAALIGVAGPLTAVAAVVVAFAGSRAAAPMAASLARGRVRAGSAGAWFAARTGAAAVLVASGTATAVALTASGVLVVDLLTALVLGLATGLLVGEWLIRTRGGLDGDGIGAIVEVTFAAILLFDVVAIAGPPFLR